MASKVYVGNLSWNTTDDSLRKAFSEYGQVVDAIVMRDRDTGRSRGFGFVTLNSESEAQDAIARLNETELEGRRIKVNFANARPPVAQQQPAFPVAPQGYAAYPSYGYPTGAQPQFAAFPGGFTPQQPGGYGQHQGAPQFGYPPPPTGGY